jgi:phosphatidylglycerophosphate synthase
MLATEWYHFPTWASLLVITLVLTVAIVASLRAESREHEVEAQQTRQE